MMGVCLFRKLRTVGRLERVIDEVKCSPETSDKRNFDFLWTQLQEFLVEEREEVNARSVEQSLRSPKKAIQPKAKAVATPAVPRKSSEPKPSDVKAVPANPKSDSKPGPKAGGKKPKTAEEKAKTPCIFHQMPSGCIHGDEYEYSHAASAKAPPPKASAEAKPKPKPKASGPSPKVAAAVVTALGSVMCPSQALGTLEFAADTGAGRHLVSFEALRDQGFDHSFLSDFASESREKKFSTRGGHKDSSQTIGFRDSEGFLSDANHFLLESCPNGAINRARR